MSVDVFGRRREKAESSRGIPGIGYKLTQDGQYDIENKRICNLASPLELNDAVNFYTFQQVIKEEQRAFHYFKKEVSDWLENFKFEVQEIINKNSKNGKSSRGDS